MSTKNKNNHQDFSWLLKFADWSGFTAMFVAALLSLVELHQVKTAKEVAVLQPAYVMATDESNMFNRGEELIRREKEETAHTVVSYGETMRSHPTSGAQ